MRGDLARKMACQINTFTIRGDLPKKISYVKSTSSPSGEIYPRRALHVKSTCSHVQYNQLSRRWM